MSIMSTNFNHKFMKALPAAMLVAGTTYLTAECINRANHPYSETLAKQALNECENRVNTYRELKENDVDIKPYLSNYGKAQVALDSVKTTKFCNSRGLYPTTYKDAEFLKDSIDARDCGIEPYKRTDNDMTKTYRQNEISKAKILQLLSELYPDMPESQIKQLVNKLEFQNKQQNSK